jgi:hypothetical protein
LIPARGLTLLVAKPKMRKSFFVLDLAICVSMEQDFLSLQTKQGAVLYVTLEDDSQRIQERSRLMFPQHVADWQWADTLHFTYDCPRMDEGGLEAISNWHHDMIKDGHRPCFIAIDVFQRIRPRTQKGQDKYEVDYDAVGQIKTLSATLDTPIILVHHARKMDGTDTLDVVSGSQGIAGAADNIFIIRKDKQGDMIFEVLGRDVEPVTLLASFDDCRWRVDDYEYEPMTRDQRQIKDFLQENGEKSLNEIASQFGEKNIDSLRMTMKRMAEEGQITRPRRGFYGFK